jgi:hypothetical protein
MAICRDWRAYLSAALGLALMPQPLPAALVRRGDDACPPRGKKPPDLLAQVPTKFETAINLQTATAHGLKVPPGMLATADEAIE